MNLKEAIEKLKSDQSPERLELYLGKNNIGPEGAKYKGLWEKGKANGHGTYTYSDGDVYEGEWADDKYHGQGIYPSHFMWFMI